MKAIRVHQFGGPEKLVMETVPDLTPGPGEVVVKIQACGVNPVDTYIRSGAYARKPELPYTPGADGGGIVKSVGPGVDRLHPGDRVYIAGSISGTYAEEALCRESTVHRLPENTTVQQGAAVGVPYATAYRALIDKAQCVGGESVLVHGASGGVGIAAVQIARAYGLTVIGTAGTDKGRDLVRHAGAHHVLDHGVEGLTEEVQRVTHGGVNIVLEMLANKNLAKDLAMLSSNGRIVIIGNRGTIEINPRDAMARDALIYGLLLFNTPEKEMQSIHAALVAGLEAGYLQPVIGTELPLEQAARAHELVMEPGHYGKIVLIP